MQEHLRDKIILAYAIIKKGINAHRTDLLKLPLSFPTYFVVSYFDYAIWNGATWR